MDLRELEYLFMYRARRYIPMKDSVEYPPSIEALLVIQPYMNSRKKKAIKIWRS